jgi:hypothetical protein
LVLCVRTAVTYRKAIAGYDQAPAATASCLQAPLLVRRRKIVTILAAPVAFSVLLFAVALGAVIVDPSTTVADPAPAQTSSAPPAAALPTTPATASPVPIPTAVNTAAAEKARAGV